MKFNKTLTRLRREVSGAFCNHFALARASLRAKTHGK